MILKAIRKQAGLSQVQLAQQIGVAQSTVAMWETGTNNPSSKNLLALSEALHCTTDELLKAG